MAFLATFPLLLALSGILGLVLKGDPSLQASIQKSALSEFPIIGTQLKSQIGVSSLGHSTPALIIGIVGAILGGQGLANAVQNTFNTVWNVSKVVRPGFPSNYLRTFGLLGLLGLLGRLGLLGVGATAAAASLAGAGNLLGLSGPHQDPRIRALDRHRHRPVLCRLPDRHGENHRHPRPSAGRHPVKHRLADPAQLRRDHHRPRSQTRPGDFDVESVVKGYFLVFFEFSATDKEEDQMFSKATRSQILLEARADPLGRGDQKRMTKWVNRQTERLSGCDRDDVDSSLTRIDTGDVRLGHGGA